MLSWSIQFTASGVIIMRSIGSSRQGDWVQSRTLWDLDWLAALYGQAGLGSFSLLYKESAHMPPPVRILFEVINSFRGNSKPADILRFCQVVVWIPSLVIEALGISLCMDGSWFTVIFCILLSVRFAFKVLVVEYSQGWVTSKQEQIQYSQLLLYLVSDLTSHSV